MNRLQPMPPYPWQDVAWSTFLDKLNADRLPHAILLKGERGAAALAQAMAQYLFCLAPIETVACGKCKDCELYLAGSHPDFHMTVTEEKSKQIKVDQIRQLNEFVSKTAQRERRKIVVITPAEAMNLNACNALLKCLEEPSGNTLFLLVQQSQKALLPTIRSRCSVMDLKSPSFQQARDWLAAQGVEEPENALFYAMGSPLQAWDWIQAGTLDQRKKIFDTLDRHLQTKLLPLQMVETLKSLDIQETVAMIVFWLETVIRAATRSRFDQSALLFRLRDSLLQKRRALAFGMNLNETLLLEEIAIDLQMLSSPQIAELRNRVSKASA